MSTAEVVATTAVPKKPSFIFTPRAPAGVVPAKAPTTVPASVAPTRTSVTTPVTLQKTTPVVPPPPKVQATPPSVHAAQQARKHSFIHTPNIPQAPTSPEQMIHSITNFTSEAHRMQAIRSAHSWFTSAPAALQAQIGAPRHDEIEEFTKQVLLGLQSKSNWKQLEETSEKNPFRPLRWLLFAVFGKVEVKDYEKVLRWLGMPSDVSIETTLTYRNTVVEATRMGSLHVKDVEWRTTTTVAAAVVTAPPPVTAPVVVESVKTVVEVKTVEVIVEKPVEKPLSTHAIDLLERLYTKTESDEDNDVLALARELNVTLKTQQFLLAWEAQRKLPAGEAQQAAIAAIYRDFEGVRCIRENLPDLYEGLLNWKHEQPHS